MTEGQPFHLLYGRRGEPESDSERMRFRLATLVQAFSYNAGELAALVESEHGISLSPYWVGTGKYSWKRFLAECDLRDVLHFVTTVWRHLEDLRASSLLLDDKEPDRWTAEVGRIFAEENLGYRVDARGGVHLVQDEEFERGRAATIAVLGTSRYVNVLNSFEDAVRKLTSVPPDGKNAVRAAFSAAEGLFRIMFPTAPRLTSGLVGQHLLPLAQQIYSADQTALRSATKSIASVKEWIDACHNYRHEPGVQDVVAQPPFDLAVFLVSSGAALVRWLAELDRQSLSAGP